MANVINQNTLALIKGEGLDEILSGALTAKKAEQDADGNVISTTYATKSEVNTLMSNINELIAEINELKTATNMD